MDELRGLGIKYVRSAHIFIFIGFAEKQANISVLTYIDNSSNTIHKNVSTG